MSSLENQLAYYRNKFGITEEQELQLLKIMDEEQRQNPQGVHKSIKLLEEQAKVDLTQAEKEAEIKKRIESGEISAATFNDLTPEEQQLAKLVLFKQYSPDQTNIPKALSGIEFIITSSLKFLDKAIDKTKLTVDEQMVWDSLIATINKSDMSITSSTDWRYQYLDNQFAQTQQNRDAYFQEKVNITGSI